MSNSAYQDWESQVEEAKTRNNKVLNEFKNHLETKSLKSNTIKKHVDNIDFFANEFLLRYEIVPIEKGLEQIGSFLGDYFIRKAIWASKLAIQENITSFKKFYSFLHEKGLISEIELAQLKELIKEEKPFWIEEVENYWNNIERDL